MTTTICNAENNAETFMLNVVYRFGHLNLDKYGILKWKMCNPEYNINTVSTLHLCIIS